MEMDSQYLSFGDRLVMRMISIMQSLDVQTFECKVIM